MIEAHWEPKISSRFQEPPPPLDATRVALVAESTTASRAVADALKRAGYRVSTSHCDLDAVHRLLRSSPIELLVLDGADSPAVATAILDAVRTTIWELPIILVAGRDSELRAQGSRLGVEVILDEPLAPEEVRRAALRLAPVVPELELSLTG